MSKTGYFHGVVVDNLDPEKAGRVRAAIPELFMDLETGAVEPSPWIEASGGLGAGFGVLNVPPIGAPIEVHRRYNSDNRLYLLSYKLGRIARAADGESNAPAVTKGEDDESASALKAGVPFLLPSKGTVSARHGAPSFSLGTTTIDGFPGTTNAGQYPYVRGIKTPGGIVVELDDTPNASRIHLWHPSGAHIEISNEGVRVDQQSARWERTIGHRTAHVGQDDRVSVDGHRRTHIGKDDTTRVVGRALREAAVIAESSVSSSLYETRGRMTLRATEEMEVRCTNTVRVNAGKNLQTSAGQDDTGVALGKFSRTAMKGMALSVPDTEEVKITGTLNVLAQALAKSTAIEAFWDGFSIWRTALVAAMAAAGPIAEEGADVGATAAFAEIVTLLEAANLALDGADGAARAILSTSILKAV